MAHIRRMRCACLEPVEAAHHGAWNARELNTLLLGELPLKQAVQLAAKITGANRSDLYQQALQMKKQAE